MSGRRVALYARVSSEPQVEAKTIDSQLAALRERIAADGEALLPDQEFVDDGYSGATLLRPALERLRDRAAAGEIDRLYVHSPDRLARNYAYQVLLLEELKGTGVELVFLNRELGRSPEDDLLLQVQGMVAEYERAKIMERSRRGKRHAAQTGRVSVLSGAPYGYRYVTKREGGGDARYEVLPDEAEVVRRIFGWVGRERLSLGEVRRRLSEASEPTRSGKTWWDRTTIWGILKNPVYQGTAAFGKTQEGPLAPRLRAQRKGSLQPRRPTSTIDRPPEEWTLIPVPPIVEAALFAAVQEQLGENRLRARERARGAKYLLQGLLVCSGCGYAYYGKAISLKSAKGHSRDYAYYRCIGTDAYRFGGERVCSNRQVRTDRLDAAVWQEVCTLLEEPRRLEQEYTRRLESSGAPGAPLSEIEGQIGKLRQGLGRLIDSYAEGWIEKGEFEPRVGRLRERIGRLEGQREALQAEAAAKEGLRLVIGRLEEFATRVKAGLEEAEWLARREIIRALVKRVEVGADEVKVVFRVEPVPFGTGPGRGLLPHWGGSSLARTS
jgi:site-specific DNA recombinase